MCRTVGAYRSFLDRLGEALRQHLKSLEHARAVYEKKRALWSAKAMMLPCA